MREYTKALQAIQDAAEHDTDNQHAKEIQSQEYKIQTEIFTQRGSESQEETYARAMRDPEVAVRLRLLLSLLFGLLTALFFASIGGHGRSCHAANSPAGAD